MTDSALFHASSRGPLTHALALTIVAALSLVTFDPAIVSAQRRSAKPHRAKPTRRVPNMPRGWTWPPSRAMRRAGAKCLTELTRAGIGWTRAKHKNKITTPVTIPSLQFGPIALQSIWRKAPFVMDCHLALALAREASALAALGVKTLRFSTIHEVRRAKRNGKRKRVLSRHAVGLAIDVFEFTNRDGATIVVKRDYRKKSRLLRSVERHIRSSPAFRAVITPGSDPQSHADHYHFEARVILPRR